MRSPFEVFRKHQKILMVVLVGMSMVGLVLLGALPNDPTNVPRALGVIAVLAVVGGAAWIAGMPSGRSNEYGLWGLVAGGAVAFALMFMGNQPQLAVLADTGDLTVPDLQNLRSRREIANQFVVEALRQTRDQRELSELMPKYTFNYARGVDEDAVTAELLHREAERLGLRVTETAVTDYIRKVTGGKISAGTFKDIRTRLHVSEPELYAILAYELEARMAAKFLYGLDPEDPQSYSPSLPPEQYWDLYRKMFVKQRVEVAAVPIKEFIDESAQPTPEQLAELFDKYKSNEPLVTPEGKLEEGRPGFKQPRRVRVASLEAVYEDYKPGIAPVTDEEIQKRYEEQYVKAAARSAAARRNAPAAKGQGGPALPESLELQLPELPEQPASDKTPATEPSAEGTPATEAPAESTPAADSPPGDAPEGNAPESTNPPATEPSPTEPSATEPQAGGGEGGNPPAGESSGDSGQNDGGLFSVADGSAEEEPSPETQPAEQSTAQSTTPQTPVAETAESAPGETEPAAAEATTPETPVAEPAAESGTTQTPATEPGTETPAAEPAATPAETPPETAGTAAEGVTPAAPEPNIPLLDDALKTQIRGDIERERTAERQRKAIEAAVMYIDENVAYYVSAPEDEPGRITPERAVELLQAYAAEHRLHYSETPLLSLQEFREDNDEYPVGDALVADDRSGRTLVDALFQTGAQDTYRPIVAENVDTQSWFAAWKLGEQPPYEPKSLDDERVREQVVKTWRELQAREKAEARARELAEKARSSGQTLSAVLGETTITGAEGGLFLTVTETPEFAWLSTPSAMRSNPFFPEIPRIQDPPGVTGAGEDFMRTVFDELQPGEVGTTASYDRSTYYVVRVVSRTPSPNDSQWETFRERFLREPVFQGDPLLARFGIERPSVYEYLAAGEVAEYQPDWLRGPQGLWTKHGAMLNRPGMAGQP